MSVGYNRGVSRRVGELSPVVRRLSDARDAVRITCPVEPLERPGRLPRARDEVGPPLEVPGHPRGGPTGRLGALLPLAAGGIPRWARLLGECTLDLGYRRCLPGRLWGLCLSSRFVPHRPVQQGPGG